MGPLREPGSVRRVGGRGQILQPKAFGLVDSEPPLQATESACHSAQLLAMLL